MSIVCNMVVTKFFFSISEQNNPKIVRKYRAAWNFLQIYFETLSDYASRIIIIRIMILYIGVPRGQVFTLQRRFVFPGFHQIIELKTSKHEFADIIHQNKQGFDGKKLREGQAGSNSLRFNNMCCKSLREAQHSSGAGTRHIIG